LGIGEVYRSPEIRAIPYRRRGNPAVAPIIKNQRRNMFATADLMDNEDDNPQSCDLQFRDFGRVTRFHGRVRTVSCREDNVLVRRTLSEPGHGDVLVVDGGGLLHRALVGDVIAGLAIQNGWAGIVVNGAIRDSGMIGTMEIGVKALGTNPRRCPKTGLGAVDVTVSFGGVIFTPGSYLYSDEDGIVVLPRPRDPAKAV
jgi:regulator of ribonuclease activity A